MINKDISIQHTSNSESEEVANIDHPHADREPCHRSRGEQELVSRQTVLELFSISSLDISDCQINLAIQLLMFKGQLLKVFESDCTFTTVELGDVLQDFNSLIITTFGEEELWTFVEPEDERSQDPGSACDSTNAVEKVSPTHVVTILATAVLTEWDGGT